MCVFSHVQLRDTCDPLENPLDFNWLRVLCVCAAAASALCVGRPGAMPSLPSRDEVDKRLSRDH